MTKSFNSFSLSYLFKAALAELVLHSFEEVYLGKAKILSLLYSRILLQAQSDALTSGIHLSLPLVFRRLQG